MILTAVTITAMPGVTEPFTVDGFAPGVSVIIGPNASGKTRLVRALAYLLAPTPQDPQGLLLAAEFRQRGDRWRVARVGQAVTWYRNGDRAAAPALPDRDTLAGYLIRIEELLELSGSDANVTAALRRELTGGYDLGAVADAFTVQPGRDRRAGDALRAAEQALRAAELSQRELAARHAELPRLARDIDDAQSAAARAASCRDALAYLDATAALDDAKRVWDAFPGRMPAPDTAQRLTRLSERYDALQQERTDLARERDMELRARDGVGLRTEDAIDFDAAFSWLSTLHSLDAELRTLRAQHETAAATLRASGQETGLSATPPTVTSAQAQAIEHAALLLHAARTELSDHEARARALADAAVPRRWLPAAAVMLGIAAVGATGALAWIAGDSAVASLAFLGVAVLAVGHALGWQSDRTADEATLRHTEQACGRAHRNAEEAAATFDALLREAGLAGCSPGTWSTHLFIQRLLRHDDCRRAAAAAEAELRTRNAERAALHARLGQWLRDHGVALALYDADGATLDAALRALQRRAQQLTECQRTIAELERALARTGDELSRVTAERADLYIAAGVTVGDRETLLARCADLEHWQAARDRLRECRVRADAARTRVDTAAPDLLAHAAANDRAALETELAGADAAAQRLPVLLDQHAMLRADIAQVERNHPLAQRRAERDRCATELRERFVERMHVESTRFLLDDIAAEHRSAHQPHALRRADALLRAFTNHRHGLALEQDGALVASDALAGETRNLTELSVGTRMQALIALRIAWAERHERHGVTLPLILDEALTTTDPERFDAAARALTATIAADGRQILYLSAQPEDALRWQRATGAPPRCIDLAAIRLHQQSAPPGDLQALSAVPALDANDPLDWAERIGVQPIRLHADAGSIHLFHLLRDDVRLCHTLLTDYRIETVGQLVSLLEQGAARRLDAAVRAGLRQRIAAAIAWYAACHVGRGRPVDRATLMRSPARNWQSLDALVQRADGVAHDGRAFLASLQGERIAGVGPGRIEIIADWLDADGYIESAPPLDATERFHRALAAVAPDTAPATVAAWIQALELGAELSPISN